MSSYNIKVETEYCVIVFEWLYYDGVDEYKIYNSKSGKMCFGQTLGLTSSIESSLTWTSEFKQELGFLDKEIYRDRLIRLDGVDEDVFGSGSQAIDWLGMFCFEVIE